MAHDMLREARELLSLLTPLRSDCGGLCAAACCQGGEGEGMYLFPGEAALYRDTPWARVQPSAWRVQGQPVPLLSCPGQCPRTERPLACRLFPLTLSVAADKRSFEVIADPRAWACCPLMPHGLQGLSKEFVTAVEQAFALLWEDPLQRGYLLALDALLREMRSLS